MAAGSYDSMSRAKGKTKGRHRPRCLNGNGRDTEILTLPMQVVTTMAKASGQQLLEVMTPNLFIFHGLRKQGPMNLNIFRQSAKNSRFCDRLRLAVESVNQFLGTTPTTLKVNQWRAVLQPLANGGTWLRSFEEDSIRVGFTDFFWAP